jgi:hypothetical protein
VNAINNLALALAPAPVVATANGGRGGGGARLTEEGLYRRRVPTPLFASPPLVCPNCGADLRIVAFITETAPVGLARGLAGVLSRYRMVR